MIARIRSVFAVDPHSTAQDLARPGHIFPLRARKGGVLVASRPDGSFGRSGQNGRAYAGGALSARS